MNIIKINITLFIIIIFIKVLPGENNLYQLNFYKDNLSWAWLGQLSFDYPTSKYGSFRLNNQFTSNVFRENLAGNKWKDKNNFYSSWSYSLTPKLISSTEIQSYVFSDKNFAEKFSKHLLLQRMNYSPEINIHFVPAAGWSVENIHGFPDQGFYSQMETDIGHYEMGEYNNTTKGFSSLYFYPSRKNQEHRYSVAFSRRFSAAARDSIQVGYEFMDKSNPLPITNVNLEKNMEAVKIDTRFLFNHLHYKISQKSLLNVETKIQTKDGTTSNLYLKSNSDEFIFSNIMGIRYLTGNFNTGLEFLTSQKSYLSSRITTPTEVVKSESRTDYESLQSAFNYYCQWRMSSRDETRFNFSYTKYEYSSPDTSRNIDEDDLRFIINLVHIHQFSQYFSIRINANADLYHQIYIHPSRSANNNWNRIIQLSPSCHLNIPQLLRNFTQIRILANYTVYDFEDILPEIRSYIFRKLTFTDSLNLQLSSRLKLVMFYQLELGDNGTFFKDVFAERVSRELKSHFIDLSLVYMRYSRFRFTTAFNWDIRKEWRLEKQKELVRDKIDFSPRLGVLYKVGTKMLLHAVFATKKYHEMNTRPKYFTTGRVLLKYLF
jgi:hypothetical protein